ncbi:MAG: hypothetical protein AABZ64_17245, partial [Nitrospinota bacterium]
IVSGLLVAGVLLALTAFRESLPEGSPASAVIDNLTAGINNVDKLPDIKFLGEVLLILGAVVGVVYFCGRKMGYFGPRQI